MLSTHLAASGTPAPDSTRLKEVVFSGGAVGEVWLCGGQSNMAMPVKVLPLKGAPITGILWYQGESNADSTAMAAEYDVWLRGLIASWRKLFGVVPFLIVELPHYNSPTAETPACWEELRAAQKRCASSCAKTFWIPGFDLGDEHDIHPKRKRAMGERIEEFIQENLKN